MLDYFQLLEMMGLLIERPLVHRDFQAKYPLLLSMYNQELDHSKAIFNQQLALNRSQQVKLHCAQRWFS
jgi:dynein heavy chain